jgi:hypothetical protein
LCDFSHDKFKWLLQFLHTCVLKCFCIPYTPCFTPWKFRKMHYICQNMESCVNFTQIPGGKTHTICMKFTREFVECRCLHLNLFQGGESAKYAHFTLFTSREEVSTSEHDFAFLHRLKFLKLYSPTPCRASTFLLTFKMFSPNIVPIHPTMELCSFAIL